MLAQGDYKNYMYSHTFDKIQYDEFFIALTTFNTVK